MVCGFKPAPPSPRPKAGGGAKMCCCAKPNKNGEPGYSWGAKTINTRPVNPPPVPEGETLVYDEPGRCAPAPQVKGQAIDYHSHHFRVTHRGYGARLWVRHGGGDEVMDFGRRDCIIELLAPMNSDARYLMLHALYSARSDGARAAEETERQLWRQAAAEKRIKTRKMPRRETVKVWIEPKRAETKTQGA